MTADQLPAAAGLSPAALVVEAHLWPGVFRCWLASDQGRYYAVTDGTDRAAARTDEMPGEDAARDYLATYRARLVLALPAAQLLAAVSASAPGGREILYAAAAADDGAGRTWLATSEQGVRGSACDLASFSTAAEAIEAFAAAAEEAAGRIVRMPVRWPQVTAAHLRHRAQLVRAGAARAAFGDVLRGLAPEIRAQPGGVGDIAVMTELSAGYVNRIMSGEVNTWDRAMPVGADLLSGQRVKQRPAGLPAPGAPWLVQVRLAIAADSYERARAIAGAVLRELDLTDPAGTRITPMRDQVWSVRAEARIGSSPAGGPVTALAQATRFAERLPGTISWTVREAPADATLEWPPGIWEALSGSGEVLMERAVRAASIRACASTTVKKGRRNAARAVERPPAASGIAAIAAAVTSAAALDQVLAQVAGRFSPRGRGNARDYLRSLLSASQRSTARAAGDISGDPDPDPLTALLRGVWSADGVREDLRDYVKERVGDPAAILVAGDTGFARHGIRSAGVQKQPTGPAGREQNCQLGIFLAYSAPGGAALIDRELFLPREWTNDRSRCRRAGIGDDVGYAAPPELARRMLARAEQAEMPFRWFAAGEAYGRDGSLRGWLEAGGISYVLGVPGAFAVRGRPPAAELAAALAPAAWHHLGAGPEGSGPLTDEWAMLSTGIAGRPLLARRAAGGGRPSFFACHIPGGADLAALASVARAQRDIGVLIQTARDSAGLDEYTIRLYDGWYRHITLSMLALASLTVQAGPLQEADAAAADPGAGPVVLGAGAVGEVAVRVPRWRKPSPDAAIGRRLRDRRVELGMSQGRLAEGLVSVGYVSLIEAGRRTPEPDVLDRLAQRLDCSADYLRTGSAPRRN